MGEGPKNLRDDAVRNPRDESIAGPIRDDITGRPLTGLDRPGGSEALGYAGAPVTGNTGASTPDTAEIRAEIEQTRANISDTVDAIQQKLSPSNMAAQATDAARDRVRRAADVASDAVSHAAETAREYSGRAADAAREYSGRAADAAREYSGRAASAARQYSGRAATTARENPWATAAAVAGVGALAWWLMSRREEQEFDEFDDEEATFDDLSEESLYYDENLGEEGTGVMQTVRNKAVPIAIAGAGLAYWVWSRQSGRSAYDSRSATGEYDSSWSDTEGYGAEAGGYRSFGAERDWSDTASETADRVKGAVSSAADRARDVVSDAGDRARGVMGDVRSRARGVVGDVKARTRSAANRATTQVSQASRRAGSQLAYWMDHNPLAVGAAAMALGVAVGMALPESRREQELMGDTRDRLLDRAQNMAGGAVDRAKQKVREVANKASDAMNQAGTSSDQPSGGGLGQNPR